MNLFRDIFISFTAVTLLACIMGYKKREYHSNFLLIYLLLILITSLVSIAVIKIGHYENNMFVFHIYTPLEFAILSWLYYRALDSLILKRLALFMIPIFTGLSIFFSLFIQTIDSSNSVMIMLESVIVVIWSVLFLRETIVLQRENQLQRYPMFWISTGILFYFVSNLVFEGLFNHTMIRSVELAKRLYMISFIFKYVLFILFIISTYCHSLFAAADDRHV